MWEWWLTLSEGELRQRLTYAAERVDHPLDIELLIRGRDDEPAIEIISTLLGDS